VSGARTQYPPIEPHVVELKLFKMTSLSWKLTRNDFPKCQRLVIAVFLGKPHECSVHYTELRGDIGKRQISKAKDCCTAERMVCLSGHTLPFSFSNVLFG
jgi:hypothetical protein